MIVIMNFCIRSASRKILPIGYTFRVDYDIWTTRESQISCGEIESPFRKLAPHSLLSLPYDDFTPDFVNYFRLTNTFPLRRDFMGHMASEPRSPVIPANLVETLPELHPFTEEGMRNRCVEVFDGFDTRCSR